MCIRDSVDIRRTVLGEVVVDSLVSAASVQVHQVNPDNDIKIITV